MRRQLLYLLSLIVSIVVLDQITKFWAVAALKPPNPAQEYLYGTVRLMYAENIGAWGSLGSTWPAGVRLAVMTLIPLGILGWLTWKLIRDHSVPAFEATGYALIVGGGLGNIIDRLRLGYVVDFMYMGVGGIGTNVFNVADMAIVAAIICIVIDHFRTGRRQAAAASQTQASGTPAPGA